MQDSQIIRTEYSDVMKKSYIDYAMSVIIARALPDVRDGLKPVQRRTLYDMYELGIRYDRPYRKCARIVGDTMGKYHPHGDSSIYEALVVMAQDFKKGMTLVDGHGNFGSIEGDGAAAMRYTEARLEKLTQEVFLGDLDKDIVGEHLDNYDSILVLSHFKGHAMGGFGGALKNISIGIASTHGKTNIHTAGVTTEAVELFNNLPPQDHFLESMADACKAVISHKGAENMLYINVANRLSVDCDCDSHPAEPEMADLGIFASTDPVAVDQACYDAVINSPDPGKKALIERMDSRHGIHTVEAAAQHGLGSREYEIISLDD